MNNSSMLKKTMPQVVRRSIFDMQVCVPEFWTNEQVKHFADENNMSGTSRGWIIRKKGDKGLNGDPERVQCSNLAGYVHVMLDA